jgi:hypothetical protein
MRRLLAAAAVSTVAVAAAGCGRSGGVCLGGAGSEPRSADAATPATAYLTAVAVTRAGCADRVAFRFAAGEGPGYRVEYRPAAAARTEDASGRRIAVDGKAFLVVRLAGAATARSDGASLTRTYAGSRRLAADGARHVRELVETGDFEAVVTWAIGLDERRPFTVTASGSSLVIEIG